MAGWFALTRLLAQGAAQEVRSLEGSSPFASTSASSRPIGDLGRVGGATLEDARPISKAFLKFEKSLVTTAWLLWLTGGK